MSRSHLMRKKLSMFFFSRVKSALKKQMMLKGQPFSDPNSLVSAALKAGESSSLGGAESHTSLTQSPVVLVSRFVIYPEFLLK